MSISYRPKRLVPPIFAYWQPETRHTTAYEAAIHKTRTRLNGRLDRIGYIQPYQFQKRTDKNRFPSSVLIVVTFETAIVENIPNSSIVDFVVFHVLNQINRFLTQITSKLKCRWHRCHSIAGSGQVFRNSNATCVV